VSKRLYAAAAPILYHSVAIRADEDDLLITVDGLLHANQRADLLRYTNGVQISSPFRRRLKERCFHNNDFEDEDDGYSDEDEDTEDSVYDELQARLADEEIMESGLRQLIDKVMLVLTRCTDGGLRTFT
jgi:hypothetical protein